MVRELVTRRCSTEAATVMFLAFWTKRGKSTHPFILLFPLNHIGLLFAYPGNSLELYGMKYANFYAGGFDNHLLLNVPCFRSGKFVFEPQ